MSLPQLRQSQRRFLVFSLDALLSRALPHLVARSETAGEIIENVYFNTEHLSLPFGAYVKATRRLPELSTISGDDDLFQLTEKNRRSPSVEGRPAKLSEIPAIVSAGGKISGLRPYFAVRYRRALYQLKNSSLRLAIDYDVQYYSLLGQRTLIGQEAHPRVKLGNLKETANCAARIAFEEILQTLKKLPVISKQWMGYSLMEEHYRYPLRNEFPRYEYEGKLEAEMVEIEPSELPFEHLQSFQGQTIRRYYQKYRASLRAERATIAHRGSAQLINGVSKRQETKEKNVSAWNLPEPWAEVNRFKKFFTVRNPETNRVYSIAVDRCVARNVLCQAEVEYNGVLEGNTGGAVSAVQESPRAEAEVIEDILLLRDALTARYGFQPTTLSKKRWLRKQMA